MGELIEELYPEKPILPKDPFQLASRQITEIVNSGMQPFQKPSIFKLSGMNEEKQQEFLNITQHRGLQTLEQLVGENYCVGDHLTIADFTVVCQIRNLIE